MTTLAAPPSQDLLFPSPPDLARLFDRGMLGAFPWIARGLGYSFRVGTQPSLEADAKKVLSAVWQAKRVAMAPEAARYAERYDPATTWIVAYHRGSPVGVMGLLDMRIASVALDDGGQKAPPSLPLKVTREIGRLAILPEHRGGSRVVMLGLLREMLVWSVEHGIEQLFSGSTPALFQVYKRYNATARLVAAPLDPVPSPERDRYFAPLRAYGGEGVVYTFDVAGATPFQVFSRTLAGLVA
jgi:hypothetical protein